MNFFETLGQVVLLIVIIAAAILIITEIRNRRKNKHKQENSKSSFILSVNDTDLESKYTDLNMMSFDDIGGLKDVKVELKKYVKCFDCREEFKAQSVDMPRGILLWGPPGCGKTSLAKAIALEAHVNFICRNASDLIDRTTFSEGTGDTIAKLFKEARKMAPCIVFIDELDVLGSRYNGGMVGFAGKHQVEITRLLSEMDGFQDNNGVLVIAATNDMYQLDPALLRSGRFGRKYYIGPPVLKEDILEIVRMYIKDKRVAQEVTEDVLVTMFSGRSPADIKAVLNECGVYSVLNNKDIDTDIIRKSILEIDLETNFDSKISTSEAEKRLTARHEAGHAIVAKALGVPIQTVTILGTSTGVRGLTQKIFKTLDDSCSLDYLRSTSINYMLRQVVMCYGGVAVEIADGKKFSDLDVGCSRDIEQATVIVRDLVISLGYTNDVLANLEKSKIVSQGHNDKLADSILTELKKAQDTAVQIIKNNTDVLEELTNELISKITLADEQLYQILDKVDRFNLVW